MCVLGRTDHPCHAMARHDTSFVRAVSLFWCCLLLWFVRAFVEEGCWSVGVLFCNEHTHSSGGILICCSVVWASADCCFLFCFVLPLCACLLVFCVVMFVLFIVVCVVIGVIVVIGVMATWQ